MITLRRCVQKKGETKCGWRWIKNKKKIKESVWSRKKNVENYKEIKKARRAYATFKMPHWTSSNAFLSVHLQFVYQWGTLFNHVVDVIVKEWDSILYITIFIIIDDINNYIHKEKKKVKKQIVRSDAINSRSDLCFFTRTHT